MARSLTWAFRTLTRLGVGRGRGFAAVCHGAEVVELDPIQIQAGVNTGQVDAQATPPLTQVPSSVITSTGVGNKRCLEASLPPKKSSEMKGAPTAPSKIMFVMKPGRNPLFASATAFKDMPYLAEKPDTAPVREASPLGP